MAITVTRKDLQELMNEMKTATDEAYAARRKVMELALKARLVERRLCLELGVKYTDEESTAIYKRIVPEAFWQVQNGAVRAGNTSTCDYDDLKRKELGAVNELFRTIQPAAG